MHLPIKTIKKEQYEKYLELIPDLKREKTQKYITIVLTLTAAIILGIFAINPTFSTIANLQKQIEDSNFVEQKLQQKINNLATLQQKYNSLQSDLPIINDAIPVTAQIPLFVAELQSIAKDSSLAISSLHTSGVRITNIENKKYSSFDFIFKVSGEYQNMVSFLTKIANFQRVIAVKSIILSTTKENLELTVKGTAYFKN